MKKSPEDSSDNRVFETGYDPVNKGRVLFFDLTLFISLLKFCFNEVGAKQKQAAIKKLLTSCEWVLLYQGKGSKCSVYAEKAELEHAPELKTAKALAQKGYDVLFAPKAMFLRNEKKFDVFLIRGHIILRADLKSISTKTPDLIANRIKGGADQASRLVIDIVSDINRKDLIDGLRSGIERSNSLIEILLFYNSRFYRLGRNEILSKRILSVIK
ncbi:MAG: hypothetical protein ACTHMV_02425 [Chitinophagaceae bacterium]